ncbi:cobalamin-dependent protein [Herbivorax sp. ANBcel31]|uniref:cobalamin B12-binding domain-containing protein n=1 Tax=Herbivorax sp. ANBcel31 TaxID=3069754 RepID=UPI0027B5CBA3|nr:cobalamin-dependent protein [Herbivorax sp. ANBcel31]MDQ2085820.1 cobalamin-dependent protein [Herbivorax sp. ANBcel31]
MNSNTLKLSSDMQNLKNDILLIADEIVEMQCNLQPSNENVGNQYSIEDTKYNIEYLFSAVLMGSKLIISEYIKWLYILLKNTKVPDETIEIFYQSTKEVLYKRVISKKISLNTFDIIAEYIDAGIKSLKYDIKEPETFIYTDNPYFEQLNSYTKYILSADKNSAVNVIKDMLSKNVSIKDFYKYIFQPFQLELGRLWHLNKITVAKEHYSTATTQFIMSLLYEKIFKTKKNGNVFVGTCINGELHELGIRMVCDYIESNQWDTHYLGANMPDESIVQFAKDKLPDVIAISCTMPFNIIKIEELIIKIRNAGLNSYIMVGGYPFNVDFELWKKVGADGYSKNFEEAYQKVQSLDLKR